MRIGMMWHDKRLSSNPEIAIKEALAYYKVKYGSDPNVVYINPANIGEINIVGVAIEVSRSVLPNNIWVGMEEESDVR